MNYREWRSGIKFTEFKPLPPRPWCDNCKGTGFIETARSKNSSTSYPCTHCATTFEKVFGSMGPITMWRSDPEEPTDEALWMNRTFDLLMGLAVARTPGRHPYYRVLAQELRSAARMVVLAK